MLIETNNEIIAKYRENGTKALLNIWCFHILSYRYFRFWDKGHQNVFEGKQNKRVYNASHLKYVSHLLMENLDYISATSTKRWAALVYLIGDACLQFTRPWHANRKKMKQIRKLNTTDLSVKCHCKWMRTVWIIENWAKVSRNININTTEKKPNIISGLFKYLGSSMRWNMMLWL